MDKLKRLYKTAMARLCWAMLRAADFDKIALELLESVETIRDPAAVIPRKLAELGGADARLDSRIKELDGRLMRDLAEIRRSIAKPAGTP